MSRLEDGEVLNCSQAPNSRPDHLPVATDEIRNRKTYQGTKKQLAELTFHSFCSEVSFLLIHLKYPYVLSSNHWAKTHTTGNRESSAGERTETCRTAIGQTDHEGQES